MDNPYYSGNPWASAIEGFMGGMNSAEDRMLATKKAAAEEDYKRQLIAQSQAQEARLIQEEARKQAEADYIKGERGAFTQRITPQPYAQDGIPTTMGEGLLPPEFMPSGTANPAWMDALKEVQVMAPKAAAPLTPLEQARFGETNPHGVKAYQDASVDKNAIGAKELLAFLPHADEATAQKIGALLGIPDVGIYRKEAKQEKVKWLDGGDKLIATDALTGEPLGKTIPKALAPGATLKLSTGEREGLYEKKAAFTEIPKLRQEATASSQVLPKLQRMSQILESGNAGDTTAYLRSVLAPYAPESKSANESQLFQIYARVISGPQRANIIGTGPQTEKEGEILRIVGGGGNSGRSALRELVQMHTNDNLAKISEYNGMIEAAGTKIYKPIQTGQSNKPATDSPGLKVGAIKNGYMYMGGDPSKKSSWGKR